MKSTIYKIKFAGIILLAVAATISPLYFILSETYRWHISQPEFLQGGMELLILGILMFVSYKKLPIKKTAGILFLGIIYLSLNGVVIPFLINYLYIEIINFIGASINSLKKENMHNELSENIVTGISVWGTGAILFSLFGMGTINALRIYTIVLFCLCVYISKGKKNESLFHNFSVYTENQNHHLLQLVAYILLCLIVLALFAKTNTAQDYDSLWYGLRPEKVLIGDNSFYDYLGYGAFVYYYPKLVELLFLPISNLGDYSILQGANIFIYIFVIIEISQLMKRISDNKNKEIYILPFTLVIVSIPALANISATAKPDILGMFLGLVVIRQFYDYLITKTPHSLVVAMCACLLSTGTKLTYLLWCGICFFVMILFITFKKIRRQKIINSRIIFSDKIFIFCSIFYIAGIHYRTYKLTGYPIYPIMINFMNRIGFKSRNFAISSREISDTISTNFKSALTRIYDFIFNPKSLEHVIMLWTSSLVFFLFILFLFNIRKWCRKFSMEKGFLAILTGIYFVVMLYYMCTIRVPDGNYFILPITFLCVVFINVILCKKDVNFQNQKLVQICIALFLILHLPILFVSHSSWAYGTKPFSTEIVVNNFETESRNKEIFKYFGISLITDYLKNYENSSLDRFLSSSHNSNIQFRLPCSVEGAAELENVHLSGNHIMDTYENFVSYVNTINVKGFILFNEDVSTYAQYVKRYTSENTIINTIQDQGGVYYERR